MIPPFYLLSFSFFLFPFIVYSQEPVSAEPLLLGSSPRLDTIANNILHEGITLFEMMSRSSYANDILLNKFDTSAITGYLTYFKDMSPGSYLDDQPPPSIITIALTGKKRKPKIKYTISSICPQSGEDIDIIVDTLLRKPDSYQQILLRILRQIKEDALHDTGFYMYHDSLQLHPLFMAYNNNGEIPVYLISTTSKEGIVPFGNDFYFLFNNKGKPVYKEKIHQNLIEVAAESDTLLPEEEEASFHTHLSPTSPYISPTDICTMLLYKDYVHWKSHIVMSKNYLSFFWLDEMELKIVPRKNEE